MRSKNFFSKIFFADIREPPYNGNSAAPHKLHNPHLAAVYCLLRKLCSTLFAQISPITSATSILTRYYIHHLLHKLPLPQKRITTDKIYYIKMFSHLPLRYSEIIAQIRDQGDEQVCGLSTCQISYSTSFAVQNLYAYNSAGRWVVDHEQFWIEHDSILKMVLLDNEQNLQKVIGNNFGDFL